MKLIRPLGLLTAGALAVTVPVVSMVRGDRVFKNVAFVDAYDGDTFTISIPYLPPIFGKNLRVRVAHIDAPEMNSDSTCEKKLAIEAGLEVTRILSSAKQIELIQPKRDKYFRVLADVMVNNKILLSQHMIDKKLAYPYDGDAKPEVDWCTYGKDTPSQK